MRGYKAAIRFVHSIYFMLSYRCLVDEVETSLALETRLLALQTVYLLSL
jgi:hypothetical protein